MSSNVDVFILSGFLGSGKSTLLSHLIKYEQQQGRKVGVILNEMGDKAIDSDVVPADAPLQEILNGCICCNSNGELSLRLKEMIDTYELDVIYIESTGAAHLIEVVDACTHLSIMNDIEMKGIFTVVNARQWIEGKMSIKIKKLLKEQVKHADIIVVNKLDTIETNQKDFLTENIREVNSEAEIIPTVFAKVDPNVLLSIRDKKNTKWPVQNEREQEHAHLHLHTFTLPIEYPVNRIQLEQWFATLPGQLYRAKGFVQLDETPGLYLLNYSYGITMFERCRQNIDYQTELVFIGEGLNQQQMSTTIREFQTIPR